METSLSLTLLYTAGIAGDLALLPRLHTFIDRLSSTCDLTLMLDLGAACSPDVWHCRATGGRSSLVVLDGMGYHAANVQGALSPMDRAKLAEQVSLALVDQRNDWVYQPPDCDSVVFTLKPMQRSGRLQVALQPATDTRLEGGVLSLTAVRKGQVGAVTLDLKARPCLIEARIHDMPRGTPPNPSIAGAVDFVLAEARLYQANERIDKR